MGQRTLLPDKITREKLNSLVDRAADLIRTAVDYKFILVLLFFKRLNDVWKTEKELWKKKYTESGLGEEEAEREAESEVHHAFDIPKEYLWDQVTKDVRNLPGRLATAIGETAKLNKELQGVIDRVDFLEFARNQENRELLRQLVELFNRYDLGGEEVSPDILGDAYEHILMRFAPQKAREGEIYTPRPVVRLLVGILDPKPGESVYDPCCGSGGMLIESYAYVRKRKGGEEARRLFLHGQERNPTIYAISQMNLLLHDIRNANVADGDTLDYPKFRDDGGLMRFDVVLANPPWNQKGYSEDRLKTADLKERFSTFGYPANNKADWAWIEHMLASAKDDGRLGIVIDNGCLFRESKEKIIRKRVIERNLIECVILLPAKLFYNTGSAGAVMILNKDKPDKRKDKILFINASEEYEPHPSVRRLNTLSEGNLTRISAAYRGFAESPGFSRPVDKQEVKVNDYNLNVSLYVMPAEEHEEIDIRKEFSELVALEKESQEVRKELERYVSQLTRSTDHHDLGRRA